MSGRKSFLLLGDERLFGVVVADELRIATLEPHMVML